MTLHRLGFIGIESKHASEPTCESHCIFGVFQHLADALGLLLNPFLRVEVLGRLPGLLDHGLLPGAQGIGVVHLIRVNDGLPADVVEHGLAVLPPARSHGVALLLRGLEGLHLHPGHVRLQRALDALPEVTVHL